MHNTTGEPGLGDLFGDLSRQIGVLVRQEVRLASTEMRHNVSAAGKDVGFIVAGGALAYAGLLALVGALILLLAHVMPWWLAALVVGLVVVGVGYMLVQRGLSALRHQDLAPKATIRSLKDDATWVRQEAA